MNGHAREGEERGRGTPLDDAERVARHWNISIEKACDLLRTYTVEELVPERGYGLTASSPASLTGTSMSELRSALNVMEDSLDVGERAKLELATYDLPTRDDLDTMWAEMVTSGLHVSRPTARIVDGIPVTSMVLTKGSPQWSLLIPLLVPIGVIGLIAFGLVKIEEISRAIMPLILATGGLLIVGLALVRKPVEKAAERYIERKL